MATGEAAASFGASTKVAHALFASQPNALNESHLCFNKAHFGRPDFNVDRLVNLARRRANLQQIHSDLRVYLRVIQNSMIELINDDYADFVNLSSNLVGLKGSVDKLTKNIETIWNDFCAGTSELMASAEHVDQQAKQLTQCRMTQLDIRAQISLIKSLERLADKISEKHQNLEPIWVRSFVDAVVEVELWFSRCTNLDEKVCKAHATCIDHVKKMAETWLVDNLNNRCHLVSMLLGIVALINDIDSATNRVIAEVIGVKMEKKTDDLTVFMAELYGFIKSLRENWVSKLEKENVPLSSVVPFLDKCLLTYILSILDEHFGSVLVPSNSRLFRRCYTLTLDLICTWPLTPTSSSGAILRQIRDRFNLIVYFKLETQHILDELSTKLDAKSVRLLEQETQAHANGVESTCTNTLILCEYTQLVLNALEQVWSETVYLPTITDKLWDVTLKIIGKYIEWLNLVKQNWPASQKSAQSTDSWKILFAICSDCTSFDANMFSIALTSIWPKIRGLDLDVILFGQCISVFSNQVISERKNFENMVITDAVALVNKVMEGVSGIPRQYRWTKKPKPTAVSPYMSEASTQFQMFEDEMRKCGWNDDDCVVVVNEIFAQALDSFCNKAEQVLESVEQTGTSLQRFKRKSPALESTAINDTDEYKIKRQLSLDLEHCSALALKYNYANIERIASLIVRANDSTV